MANMTLAAGFEFDDGPIGHVVVRNITPDPETGVGKWTDAEIVSAPLAHCERGRPRMLLEERSHAATAPVPAFCRASKSFRTAF
jgi:hypothetical protein